MKIYTKVYLRIITNLSYFTDFINYKKKKLFFGRNYVVNLLKKYIN